MTVEIYSLGRAGTPEDPIVANQRATFSARINGVDAEKVNSSYRWTSSPQLHPYGSDIFRVSFGLPDWREEGTLTVHLELKGSPEAGRYKETFHVRPMTEEEKARRVVPMRDIHFGNVVLRYEVDVFEEAVRLGYLRKKGLFWPTWHYDGTVEDFERRMGITKPVPDKPDPVDPPDPEPDPDKPRFLMLKGLSIDVTEGVIILSEDDVKKLFDFHAGL